MLRSLILLALLLRGISVHARDEKVELTPLDEVEECKAPGRKTLVELPRTISPDSRYVETSFYHAEYFSEDFKKPAPPVAAKDTPVHDPQVVDSLVEKLSNDDWDIRNRAYEQLCKIVRFVIPELQAACAAASDLEQKTRLEYLLMCETKFGPEHNGLAVKILFDRTTVNMDGRVSMTVFCKNTLKQAMIVGTGWQKMGWSEMFGCPVNSSCGDYSNLYLKSAFSRGNRLRYVIIPPGSTLIESGCHAIDSWTLTPGKYYIRLVLLPIFPSDWNDHEAYLRLIRCSAPNTITFTGGAYSNAVELEVLPPLEDSKPRR